MVVGQFPGEVFDPAALGHIAVKPVEVFGLGHNFQRVASLRREPRPHEQIGAERLPGSGLVGQRGFPGKALTLHVLQGVLRHGVEIDVGDCNLQHGIFVEQPVLVGSTGTLSERRANRLVVARQRLVGVGWNAVRHDCRIENADEAVALDDMGIEKREGLAGFDGFHPQCRLAQLDGERIAVDAVDAVLHYLAQRVLPGGFVRGLGAGLDAGDFVREAASRRQQEMSRTAGRIDDSQGQNGGARVFRAGGHRLDDNRIESGLDEFAHKRWRRVVGAGQLAFRPLRSLSAAVAREGECPGRGVHVDDGLKFKQALVDGPEFLGVHVPVVDAGQRRVRTEEREVADRFQQAFVGDGGTVEIGALVGAEQAAKRRQAQAGSAIGEGLEGDRQTLPEIGAAVVMPAPERPFAQA